jgi:sugar/nucleoside kinase (ribokinase family)
MPDPVASSLTPGLPGRQLDVVVCGYAGVDYVWRVNVPPAPGRTSLLFGAVEPPPRFGGCAPLAALALADLGVQAALISWLGDDVAGRDYVRRLEAAGVDVRGVVMAPGCASPRSFLFYDPDGGATCCYHASGSREQVLDGVGRDLARSARALAVTVGPAPLTAGLLNARPPAALLAWSVKADADAFPPDLRQRLLMEAEIVCLQRDELPFLLGDADSIDAGTRLRALAARRTVVVTEGASGATVMWPAREPGSSCRTAQARPEPVAVEDPTGAGDAFFAAFLAATLRGSEPPDALGQASGYVVRMLQRRATAS